MEQLSDYHIQRNIKIAKFLRLTIDDVGEVIFDNKIFNINFEYFDDNAEMLLEGLDKIGTHINQDTTIQLNLSFDKKYNNSYWGTIKTQNGEIQMTSLSDLKFMMGDLLIEFINTLSNE